MEFEVVVVVEDGDRDKRAYVFDDQPLNWRHEKKKRVLWLLGPDSSDWDS